MNLKDVMQAEAAAIFLNVDEFAESISIEDVPKTPAVCQWSMQPEGEHLYGDPESRGVNVIHAEITIGEYIIPMPEPGQEIIVNAQYWIVRSAHAQSGLLT